MSASRSLAAIAILVAAGLVACTPPEEPSRAHWTDVTDSTEVRISEAEPICLDCITLEQVLVMGDTIGEGYLREAMHMVRDSAGNYWFGQYEAVKIFDAAGAFMGEVGRSGEGPLEWDYAMPVHTDREGRVHIFDSGNYRHSVIGPDFTLIEEQRLPDHRCSCTRRRGSMGVNMWHPTPDAIGSPLHVLQGEEIVRSFGDYVDPANPRAGTDAWRTIATDRANRTYSSERRGRYEIQVWSDTGRRITGFLDPGFNDPPFDPEAPQSADNPPPGTIRALQVDSEDRLWVLSWRLRDDWLDMMEEQRRPDGRVTLEMKPGLATMDRFDGQIDVIDLTTATVIARTRMEGVVLVDFLGEDELWSGEFFGPDHLRRHLGDRLHPLTRPPRHSRRSLAPVFLTNPPLPFARTLSTPAVYHSTCPCDLLHPEEAFIGLLANI